LRPLPRAERESGRAAARPASTDAPLRAAGARGIRRNGEQGGPRQGDARLEGRPERRDAPARLHLLADCPDAAVTRSGENPYAARTGAAASSGDAGGGVMMAASYSASRSQKVMRMERKRSRAVGTAA